VPVIGTLGVVLAARRRAWIPAARPVIERLLEQGFYLASDLVAAALREVGE
jgi:predicted nucleic acid-binding protein